MNEANVKRFNRFKKICQKHLLLKRMTEKFKVKVGEKIFIMDPKDIFYTIRDKAFASTISSITDGEMFTVENGKNFDDFIKYVQKKPVTDTIKSILERLYRYINTTFSDDFSSDPNATIGDSMERMIAPQLSERYVLVAFSIVGFPDFVLQKSPIELEQTKYQTVEADLYSLSKKLIGTWGMVLISPNKTLKRNEALRKFIKCLNMYANCYVMYASQDKVSKIQEGLQRWYAGEKEKTSIESSTALTSIEKENALKVFVSSQQKLLNIISKIDTSFDQDKLVQYKLLMDRVEFNMEKAYWDGLRTELHENKFDFFLKLLKEVREGVLSLFPPDKQNTHRIEVESKFDEQFDMDFITQMATHRAYSCSQFVALGTFLLNIMKELQAPVRTPHMMEEWNNLVNDQNSSATVRVSFENQGVNIIKFLLDEVQMIKDNMLSTQILSNLGLNVFAMK